MDDLVQGLLHLVVSSYSDVVFSNQLERQRYDTILMVLVGS